MPPSLDRGLCRAAILSGLLNAPSPKRASSLGGAGTMFGEGRQICRIDGSDNVPASCRAASGLVYPCEAQSEVAEKGAKRAMHAELLRLAHPSPPLSSAGDG
jgi:hypothetical protein